MPPLRPPGVGEPTVPTTRSASAERVFRFRCRGFDTPPVPMLSATGLVLSAPVPMLSAPPDPLLSAPSVPLLRARPSFASCPSILVRPMPACRRLSPRCPCQSVPRCLCTSILALPAPPIPAQPVATHSLLPVASRSLHCPSPFHLFPVRGHPVGRLRHDGRSLDLSPRGSIYIGAAENSNGSTTERRLDRQKPGFCGTAGCAGCRSRTGALSSRRRYFCGKLL